MAQVIADLGSDKRLILNNGYIGRQVQCLDAQWWWKIRIALRLCMSDSGANSTASTLEFCLSTQGSYRGMGNPNPTHGLLMGMTGNSNTLTRATSPTSYMWNFTGVNTLHDNASIASGSQDCENGSHYVGAEDDHRVLVFCDVSRRSTTYSIKFFRNTNLACTDVSRATFEAASLLEAPTVTDHSFNQGCTCVVDEQTYGIFNSIGLNWNKASPTIKISDLRVVRW